MISYLEKIMISVIKESDLGIKILYIILSASYKISNVRKAKKIFPVGIKKV